MYSSTKIIIFIIVILAIILLFSFTNYINMEHYSPYYPYILPKKIYGYWDNLEGNSVIISHINTWHRNIAPDWEIIILNQNNVKNYVSKEFMDRYQNLNSVRFSDFLRLELLKNNGGVWMDVSTIVTNGRFLDEYYNEMHKNRYDVCVYEYKEKTVEPDRPYLENWFIMAPKNSKYIIDLYKEFDRAFEMGFLKYKKEVLIPSKTNLKNTIGNEGDRTYLMQHAIIHYLFQMGKRYNICVKDACESMFKPQTICDWDHKKTIDYILNKTDWSDIYAVKLTSATRSGIQNDKLYVEKLNSL